MGINQGRSVLVTGLAIVRATANVATQFSGVLLSWQSYKTGWRSQIPKACTATPDTTTRQFFKSILSILLASTE